MTTCSKCKDGLVVLDHDEAKCVNCGKRYLLPSQPREPITFSKTLNLKTFDSPSILKKATDWVERSHKAFGTPPVQEAYGILQQLGEPFMREYARFEDGEDVLVLKAPFFEMDPEYQRQLEKTVPSSSPTMRKAWQQRWKQIDECLRRLPTQQQIAARKLLRLRTEQHWLYVSRISHWLDKFGKVFKRERQRNNNLQAVLRRESLFDNIFTHDLGTHCNVVNQTLDHAEAIVHKAQNILKGAADLTKKSKARQDCYVALLQIIISDPSFNKNSASRFAEKLLNTADPLRPVRSRRYLWQKALK